MKSQSLFKGFLSLVFAALLLVGCANQMEPAKQAIAGVGAALQAAGPDATKYIPDQVKAVTDQLVDLKMKFDQKDYRAVVAAAPKLLEQAKALAPAAAVKKAEFVASLPTRWTELSTSVPAAIAALASRIAAGGADAAAVEAATKTLSRCKGFWEIAKQTQAAGKPQQAVEYAIYIKEQADKALATLGGTAG